MTAQTPGCGSNTDAKKRQREAEAARAETPDTSGLREAVPHCTACRMTDQQCVETDGGCCPVCRATGGCSHTSEVTPAATPAPAEVTQGDVEALAEVMLAADVSPAERAGMPFPASSYLIEASAGDFARGILASDWLAAHDAQVRREAKAERDAAREALARVEALHKPIRVYDECEHDADHGCEPIEVYDYMGCSESVIGWGCSACCYDDEYPREDCPHGADHRGIAEADSCPTRSALSDAGRGK